MLEKLKGINISQLLGAAQKMFNNKEPIERLDLLCKLKATVTSDDETQTYRYLAKFLCFALCPKNTS